MENKQTENNQKEWAKELFDQMATIVKDHAHKHKGKRGKEEKRKGEEEKDEKV